MQDWDDVECMQLMVLLEKIAVQQGLIRCFTRATGKRNQMVQQHARRHLPWSNGTFKVGLCLRPWVPRLINSITAAMGVSAFKLELVRRVGFFSNSGEPI